MRYKFFLCKTDNPFWARRALQGYLESEERSIELQDCFLPVEVNRISEGLRAASGERAGLSPTFRFRQVFELPLLAVVTAYQKARDVAEILAEFSKKEGLLLFDGEMDCSTSIGKDERKKVVEARLAHRRFMVALRHHPRLDSSHAKQVGYFALGECFIRRPPSTRPSWS